MLEAEVKLALDEPTAARLRERLSALGATPGGSHRQVDVYFNHPERDFALTDEALRLRLDDDELRITYKGKKLDPPRKTREEIEFGLAADVPTATRLLERLGFRPVASVQKERIEYRLPGEPAVIVSLDQVADLGSFCEVETAAESAAEGRAVLDQALAKLGLDGLPPIPRSYLELLLSRRA